jgi:hypothetical protein
LAAFDRIGPLSVGTGGRIASDSAHILMLCDSGHGIQWYRPGRSNPHRLVALGAALSKEGAMTERDLTAREDRLVIFWLTAMAIVLIFVLILANP